MKYYAKYSFSRSPISDNSYLLDEKYGEVKNLDLLRYAESKTNESQGISNREYIYFGIPRNPSIRKYFAHTFEGLGNKPITSTEPLNDMNRTFGDGKQLGNKDLILFEFSDDMSKLDMYFVKDKGNSKVEKQCAFRSWCAGEKLIK